MKAFSRRLIFANTLFVAIGCAGASVTQQSQKLSMSAIQPQQIVIYPFAAVASLGVNMTMGAVKGYRSSMGSLGKMTADQMVEHLSQYFDQQGWENAKVADSR